jgi:hypothetical protein
MEEGKVPAGTERRSPLKAFLEHEANMMDETGKAFASLLPEQFRTHSSKALEEGRAGLNALLNGVIDSLERGLDRVRRDPGAAATGPSKVKIEVE